MVKPSLPRSGSDTSPVRSGDVTDKRPGVAAKTIRGGNYEPGKLREALVVEGRRMFEENGATELSLRALARRLGVSEAAPSKHFHGGKEELLAAIASDGFRELATQRVKLSKVAMTPYRKAREMMLSYVRFAQAHEGLFDLMIGPRVLPEFRRGEFTETGDVSYAYFANSIFDLARQHGWPKKSLEYLSHSAWSVEHGIAALILARRIPREDSGLDLQKTIEFAIDFFLDSVTAGPAANAGTARVSEPRGDAAASAGTRPTTRAKRA